MWNLKLFYYLIITFITFKASPGLSFHCDCEFHLYPPLSGSHNISIFLVEEYQLSTYSKFSSENIKKCRRECSKEFYHSTNIKKIDLILQDHSLNLINDGRIGYNCSGQTNFKYPIKVKAKLGGVGLGNVIDQIHVVNVDCPPEFWK